MSLEGGWVQKHGHILPRQSEKDKVQGMQRGRGEAGGWQGCGGEAGFEINR